MTTEDLQRHARLLSLTLFPRNENEGADEILEMKRKIFIEGYLQGFDAGMANKEVIEEMEYVPKWQDSPEA